MSELARALLEEHRTTGRFAAAVLASVYRRVESVLSVRETADALGCTKRTVYRAHEGLRYTHRGAFIEQPIECGRSIVGHRRRLINRMSPIDDPSGISSVDRDVGSPFEPIDLRALLKTERSNPPTATRRSKPRASKPRPARVLVNIRLPDVMRHPPYLSLEAGLKAAIVHQHGAEGLVEVLSVVRELECRRNPDETRRAARALLERPARSPGAVFRALFRVECNRTAEARIRPPDKPPGPRAATRDSFDDWIVDADSFPRSRAGPRPTADPDDWMTEIGAGLPDDGIPY